jgi:hypothetical protein
VTGANTPLLLGHGAFATLHTTLSLPASPYKGNLTIEAT